MARVLSAPADLARLTAGAVALAYGAAALAVARGPGDLTTYAGRSWSAAVAFAVAGFALVAAGVATALARRTGRSGDIALLAGYAWFAPLWAGWRGGPPLVVSIGTIAAGFAFPLLVHLVAAQPGGTLRAGAARALVLAVYLEAVAVALGDALFRDPFFDPDCWENCTDNVFLAHSLPGFARGLNDVDVWFALAAAAALAALLRHPADRRRPARAAHAVAAARGRHRARGRDGDPRDRAHAGHGRGSRSACVRGGLRRGLRGGDPDRARLGAGARRTPRPADRGRARRSRAGRGAAARFARRCAGGGAGRP